MPDPWKPVDPLGEALHFLRMSGVFYCRCEFSAPWGLDLPPFRDCPHAPLPVAESLERRIINLPSSPHLGRLDLA